MHCSLWDYKAQDRGATTSGAQGFPTGSGWSRNGFSLVGTGNIWSPVGILMSHLPELSSHMKSGQEETQKKSSKGICATEENVKMYSELCPKLSVINCHPAVHREYWKSRGSRSRKSENAHRRSHFQGTQILQLHLLLQPAAPPWSLLQLYHVKPQTRDHVSFHITKHLYLSCSPGCGFWTYGYTNNRTCTQVIVLLEWHRGQKVLISDTVTPFHIHMLLKDWLLLQSLFLKTWTKCKAAVKFSFIQ